MVATLAIVSAAFTAVLLIATAPSAMAIPAPPGESWSPPLTGGPAGQPCAGVTVLCVGPGLTYTTIGAAIAAADPGATIQVQAGTYPENLTITQSLTILGGFPAGSWTMRDPAVNVTTIDGRQLGTTISAVGPYDGTGAFTLDGLRIINGKAPLDVFDVAEGSGIRVNGVGIVTVSHNLIEDNADAVRFDDVHESHGGGVSIKGAVTATISDNIIRNNQSQRGAAIASDAPTLVVSHNLVENNDGWGNHGGALSLGGAQTTIEGNLVRGNRIGIPAPQGAGYGWGGGGHFFGPDTHATVRNNRWVDNDAATYGSGFFVDEAASATITGDVYARNGCGDRGGAGLAVDGDANVGSDVTIVNVTITDHSCPGDYHGTGLYVDNGSRVQIKNSIITGNGGDAQVFVCSPANEVARGCNGDHLPYVGVSTAAYSLLGTTDGVNEGQGMITGDPRFVSLVDKDYHLAPDSPAIDAADPADPVDEEPAPNGGRRDVGAYGGTPEATTAGPAAPIENQSAPVITGTPQVGSTLTASEGTWTNSPTGFSYQWRSGGVNVGADQNTYVPVAADVGNTVTVTVTASRAGFTSGTATSAPTGR